MKFPRIFKKEPKVETVTVKCGCGTTHTTECDGLGTMSTGYKGRIAFYTRCPKCESIVHVDETQLSKRFINRAYKNHIWG